MALDALIVRLRVDERGALQLGVTFIPRGDPAIDPCARTPDNVTVAGLEETFASLPSGCVHPTEIRTEALRVVHRQRLGKMIQFDGIL